MQSKTGTRQSHQQLKALVLFLPKTKAEDNASQFKVRSITITVFAYFKDKNNCQNRNKHYLLFLDVFHFNLKHPQ